MEHTPHQTHDTVKIREYMQQVKHKNRDYVKMCQLVKEKWDRPKNAEKIRVAIQYKEEELSEIIDYRLN